MQTYIVQVVAKPAGTRFYRDVEPVLRKAKGFRGRKIYRGQTGAMATAVRKLYTAEELAKHAEPPHEDPGTQFVIVEQWDSLDDRMHFTKHGEGPSSKDLIPHLLPAHSHEFFEDVSVD
jgi:heme-degrading monooxygenase HmoA